MGSGERYGLPRRDLSRLFPVVVHPSGRYRILSISRDPRLLVLRDETLALAGYAVASPREPGDAALLLSQGGFDAVVIADSVGQDIRQVLIATLRNMSPQTPILFVYTEPECSREPLADMCVDGTSGPMPLVIALDKRLHRAQSA